jgi:hypothetical protein
VRRGAEALEHSGKGGMKPIVKGGADWEVVSADALCSVLGRPGARGRVGGSPTRPRDRGSGILIFNLGWFPIERPRTAGPRQQGRQSAPDTRDRHPGGPQEQRGRR